MKLQTKFLGVLLPAGLASAALVLILIQRSVHSVIIGGLERGAVALSSAAAPHLAKSMEGGEMDLLPDLQDLQREEGALFVAALDAKGTVVAHTTVTEKGKTFADEFTTRALKSDVPMIDRGEARGQPVLLVAVPIWPPEDGGPGEEFLLSGDPKTGRWRRLGTLLAAVPLRAAQQTERSLIRDVSLIVLLNGGLALALVIIFVRGMLAPIGGLMSGIARTGQGRFDVEVPVLASDELGALAESFNAMSRELARTTVSKEYVEGILENMDDLVVVTDPDGRIRTLNRAATEAFGDGSAVGKPLASLFEEPPESPVPRDAEVVLRTQGGGRMPALFSSSMLRDREGRLQGYIGVAKDITARKAAEQALVAAKLAAEASNRELETFSYSVAHDLRAPLRAIDGFSQLLEADHSAALDEGGRDCVARVRAAAGRMSALIEDLLNLSRITRTALVSEQVDLSALAASIGEELMKASPERRVEFTVAKGLSARGDPNLLRLALGNLLDNAWKYTSRHETARIEFGAETLGGETVYFVRDDGAGFDMASAKRLFEPFTRLHAKSEFEGTGVGLATVQRIINRHGGRVWAESALERGAVFRFTLGEARGPAAP